LLIFFRQLLGTEEESSDHGSSEEEEELMMANSSLPPSVNCPSGGGKKSVWSITREQINYYTTQFFCMQSDPDGVIAGTLAKEFFEKSRLPIADLRKIWQLSDVSQVILGKTQVGFFCQLVKFWCQTK
jgi:hypothetical protein